MVGNFQVNARAGSEVLAPLGPGSPQPRCSRRPLQEVLSGVGVEISCVCDICLISNSQICGLAGGGGRGGLRLGHPPGHERDCNRTAESRLSWLCKTILPFTSQASQSSTAINQTRRSLPSSDLCLVHHRSDRSETSVLVRLPNLYSPGSLPRDWSAERSEADRGLNNFFSSSQLYSRIPF